MATFASRKLVYFGVLSALVPVGDGFSATLSRDIRGVPTDAQITIPAEALPAVQSMLVEGEVVRFYGQTTETGFTVIGPDLTKRTLAKAAGTTDAVATAPAAKPARVRTAKQDAAWAAILEARKAGRAKKAAAAETTTA